MADLDGVRDALRHFIAERDWEQFHAPKNLAMALSVEAAELLEHFQWLSEAESERLPEDVLAAVADEIADVQLYLIGLADRLGVDILEATTRKMEKNAIKYPVATARGNALKYNQLPGHEDRSD